MKASVKMVLNEQFHHLAVFNIYQLCKFLKWYPVFLINENIVLLKDKSSAQVVLFKYFLIQQII